MSKIILAACILISCLSSGSNIMNDAKQIDIKSISNIKFILFNISTILNNNSDAEINTLTKNGKYFYPKNGKNNKEMYDFNFKYKTDEEDTIFFGRLKMNEKGKWSNAMMRSGSNGIKVDLEDLRNLGFVPTEELILNQENLEKMSKSFIYKTDFDQIEDKKILYKMIESQAAKLNVYKNQKDEICLNLYSNEVGIEKSTEIMLYINRFYIYKCN